MVKKILKLNVFFISAVILAFLFYSRILPEPVNHGSVFKSLLPVNRINNITGTVCSTPVKIQSAGKYSVDLCVKNVSASGGFSGSAVGIVKLILPEEAVEAWYPGKLYTESQNCGAVLCDEGADLSVSGKFSEKEPGKLQFYVKKAVQLPWKNNLAGQINYYRALIRLYLRRKLFAWGKAGGFLLALIAGSKEYLEEAVNSSFRNAGLAHILALSGMHLSLFSGITGFFTKKLFGKRAVRNIFHFLIIVIFVMFAGKTPSLFRALLCSVISILVKVSGYKNYKMINILSTAFLIHICVFPSDLWNLAFILSYGALAGILLLSELIGNRWKQYFFPFLADGLSASISAQIVTAPVQACFFGTLTPVGIVSSVVVSPLVTWFIYGGLAFLFVSFCVPDLSDAAAFLMNILYNVIVAVVDFFASVKPFQL